MPDLHDIMNIVADGADNSDGDYPRMPSIDSIIGPDVKWVDHGRYHHSKDTKPFVGFEWHYGGNEMDRWWAMRKPGMKYVPGFGPYSSGYYTVHDWDYAGYTMKSGLWGEQNPVDGAEAAEVEKPFLDALQKISNVIPNSLDNLDAGKTGNFEWGPTGKVIGDLLNLKFLFEEHGEGSDSNGTLLTAYKNLDIPEGPMTGAAASMFGAKLYHLFHRFRDMESQIRNNHEAIKNIKEAISKPARDLQGAVKDALKEDSYRMRAVLDHWYFKESIGKQKWNHGTGQFWIKITETSWGPVSNPTTDENVNNRLKEIWKENFKDVINKANSLYDTLNEVYTDANRKLKVIEPPEGQIPITMAPDLGADGNPEGPDMPDMPDFPDEIDFKFDDDVFGGPEGPGPESPGPGDGGPEIPDWMQDPPSIGGPEFDYESPGGGDDVPTPGPPPFVPGSPPAVPPTGSETPPPFVPGSPPATPPTGSETPPPFVPGSPPATPPTGSETPPPFVPGAPLPPMPSPGASGSRPPSPSGSFPPPTALEIDPETGLPINPETGRPFPVDPDTGIPFVPGTDLPLHVDPETGSALPIDPVTGLPVQDGGTRLDMDPQTGLPINPETGRPFPVDPDTGIPFVPGTDLPLQYDPVTGQVAPIDPVTGLPTAPDPTYPSPTDFDTELPPLPESVYENPVTGEPAEINPRTGLPYQIDPDTGEAIKGERPPPEFAAPPPTPINSSLPVREGPAPLDLNYGGVNTPPPTSSSGPGGVDSGNSGAAFGAPPGAGGTQMQAGGEPGGFGGNAPAGTHTGMPGGGMPMMPPMGGMGGGGGGGGDNGRERNRATWLSEDEKVWGTDKTRGKAVLGRPVPGEKKGTTRHEFIDAGADGNRPGTTSNDDARTGGRKRKPGVGNRRGNGQEQTRDGDGRRDRSSD
ncbi:hypothetical protein ACWGKS_06460 [Nocardiopsis sp. NPDC055879]